MGRSGRPSLLQHRNDESPVLGRRSPRETRAHRALCCTECRAFPLEVAATKTEGAEIIDGALVCTACKRRYPIEDAIPVMLPDAIREISPRRRPSGWRCGASSRPS
ncbi:MAG: hypothetical protein IPK07_02555 [Deltaproteobacteria bacterium]|nr:hypothetical protein [Deltaproteobacteria bacterium]